MEKKHTIIMQLLCNYVKCGTLKLPRRDVDRIDPRVVWKELIINRDILAGNLFVSRYGFKD